MALAPAIGLFGGTFDPIHNGHIYPVIAAANQTKISSVALMPNYLPAHKKKAHTSSAQRLDMVKLVCQDFPLFYPEPWEIEQAKVSYSFDTLTAFRQRHPQAPICFFIGTDSLYSLPTWYRWQELLGLCHFIVCQRQTDITRIQNETHHSTVQSLLDNHQVKQTKLLHQTLAGHIYLASTPEIAVSSTEIKALIAQGLSTKDLLPSAISQYIKKFKLYQQSTNI